MIGWLAPARASGGEVGKGRRQNEKDQRSKVESTLVVDFDAQARLISPRALTVAGGYFSLTNEAVSLKHKDEEHQKQGRGRWWHSIVQR